MDGEDSYRRYVAGETSAFDDVIRIYYEGLVNFTRLFVKSEAVAEDIAIDALTELVIHKYRYNYSVSLKTYLYTIAKRRAFNYLKHQKKFPSVDLSVLQTKDNLVFTPEESVISDEQKRAINRLIEALPANQRLAVILVYYENLSYKETAKIMSVTTKQVDNYLYKAKLKLKKAMEDIDL